MNWVSLLELVEWPNLLKKALAPRDYLLQLEIVRVLFQMMNRYYPIFEFQIPHPNQGFLSIVQFRSVKTVQRWLKWVIQLR